MIMIKFRIIIKIGFNILISLKLGHWIRQNLNYQLWSIHILRNRIVNTKGHLKTQNLKRWIEIINMKFRRRIRLIIRRRTRLIIRMWKWFRLRKNWIWVLIFLRSLKRTILIRWVLLTWITVQSRHQWTINSNRFNNRIN